MGKRLLMLLVFFFSLAMPASAQSGADPLADVLSEYDYVINSFDTTYDVHADSSITVTERIAVTFNVEKHGIYRWIPTNYVDPNGLEYNLRLHLDSVTNEKGEKWPLADVTKADPFYIKIGDADVTLIGPQTYIITYTVQRGVRYFQDHDEMYWNVMGNNWDVPIMAASATMKFPRALTAAEAKMTCYTGYYGSTDKDCTTKLDGNTMTFAATRPFFASEDMTVAAWLPKGLVREPTAAEKFWLLVLDNWGFLLPVVAFAVLFLLWLRFGNDEHIERTIIAQYEENDKISPYIASVLLHDKEMDSESLSAELVYLAVRKYLKIREILNDSKTKAKDYELIKLKESDDKLKPFQQTLLSKIFGSKDTVKVSDLEDTFYKELDSVKNSVDLYIEPYYDVKPWIKHVYTFIAAALIVVSIMAAKSLGLSLTVGLLLTGIIVFIFGLFMPKKSRAGLDSLWYVEGLKHYIKVAEKNRMKFYEKEQMFEQVLPYAMVFGMAGMWAEVFKDIFKNKPDWFESDRPFSTALLSNSLTNFQLSSAKAMTSSPSSSSSGGSWSSSGFGGGGFSGGGFGGGGGGSW